MPQTTAEGIISGPAIPPVHEHGGRKGLAYSTEIAGADGCRLHIWMGYRAGDHNALREALRVARYHRDVVVVTYSSGAPTGFWASEHMEPSR